MQLLKSIKPFHAIFIFSFLLIIGATGCEMLPDEEIPLAENISEKASGVNKPINNPTIFSYSGMQSGLYSWGNSMITNTFRTNYINISKEVITRNSTGISSPTGKIGVLEIGGSNPGIVFNGLRTAELNDSGFGSKLTFVNAGLNAMDLSNILRTDAPYWSTVQNMIAQSGLTAAQIQVIFCIEDNLMNRDITVNRATSIKNDYKSLLNIIREKYPNCKVFLVGDRGYTGYTTDPQHKEPIGYLNGWAAKFLIQDYSNNLLPAYPCINWLDYYWANGASPRFDGLNYLKSDYRGGYVHFTDEKAEALGLVTHAKLKTDPGALYWYK